MIFAAPQRANPRVGDAVQAGNAVIFAGDRLNEDYGAIIMAYGVLLK
jgi:hypothetical protein